MVTAISRRNRRRLAGLILLALLVTGCTSAPPAQSPTIIRTAFNLPSGHTGFTNLLVISVAGDYGSRALFERNVAAAFADTPGQVTAYFTVVGRQPILTRTALDTAIQSRKFDAVLLTRLKGQERAELAANRPVGQSFDLFGYDYPELNPPVQIEQSPAITFVTELYSTATRKRVWAIDALSFDNETATDLINDQSSTVINQLKQDNVLAP
jgi:hypothetical protein